MIWHNLTGARSKRSAWRILRQNWHGMIKIIADNSHRNASRQGLSGIVCRAGVYQADQIETTQAGLVNAGSEPLCCPLSAWLRNFYHGIHWIMTASLYKEHMVLVSLAFSEPNHWILSMAGSSGSRLQPMSCPHQRVIKQFSVCALMLNIWLMRRTFLT